MHWYDHVHKVPKALKVEASLLCQAGCDVHCASLSVIPTLAWQLIHSNLCNQRLCQWGQPISNSTKFAESLQTMAKVIWASLCQASSWTACVTASNPMLRQEVENPLAPVSLCTVLDSFCTVWLWNPIPAGPLWLCNLCRSRCHGDSCWLPSALYFCSNKLVLVFQVGHSNLCVQCRYSGFLAPKSLSLSRAWAHLQNIPTPSPLLAWIQWSCTYAKYGMGLD